MILPIVLAATVTASAQASVTAAPPPPAATALPAGHPRVNQAAGNNPGFFKAPADSTTEVPGIPVGTIRVELRDPFDHPLANRTVDLGVVRQSIAKGDKHEHSESTTDATGVATFSNLDTGSNIAYRVSAHEADATYAATPFRLEIDKGTKVVLHVYPVMHDLPQTAQIGARAIVFLEVKDDRIQIQERVDVFNGTALAWVPRDVVMRLPDGFTAVNSMQQMSDIGVDAVAGQGARLHGTFPPGENMVMFSWQLPYSGDPNVNLEIGMPPDVRMAIVRAAAAPSMKLEVAGFREATAQVNEESQRELVTGKQLNDTEPPMRKIDVALSGLPTPGPSRIVATALAMFAIASGIYVATQQRRSRKPNKSSSKRDRDRVLDEIDGLEVARERGDVGPKTYERARRELVDELSALLATSK